MKYEDMDSGSDCDASNVDSRVAATFITKLWAMLHDQEAGKFIKWTNAGDSIVILDCTEFSTRCLSK